MQDHFQKIYQEQADEYDRLIHAEDFKGRLLPTIESIQALKSLRVVEVGVGTGRISRLLVRGGVRSICGVDSSPAMLKVAYQHLKQCAPPGSGCSWQLVVGTASHLPVSRRKVDLVIAGWVFGHLMLWRPNDWQECIEAALTEMDRVIVVGAAQIIIESLGTGVEQPVSPSELHEAYYNNLETVYGFQRIVIRTDYRFESSQEAAQLCQFFFGENLAKHIRQRGWTRVPEWTGIWWRRPVLEA
ncbi:MAG: class I SAM-dependent methyltransferase [Candidatus Aminicenantes bacterium]|jgi:ubiquinone/menaquinone biosynthesis C-methylase UbiE